MRIYKIVLCTPAPTSHRTAEENLGVGYLASALRNAGFIVTIIDAWLEGLSAEELALRIVSCGRPLWLGFSTYRSNMPQALETVEYVRKRFNDIVVVAGGYGPTFNVEEFLDGGFDYVVRGEAEKTVVELSMHLATGSIELSSIGGLSYRFNNSSIHNSKQSICENLDLLTFPSRDTLDFSLSRKSPAHILSSRGCLARCLFCSVVSFARQHKGPKWRQRSISNFIDELEDLAENGVTHVKVLDDSFIEPPRDARWCENFSNEIGKRNLKLKFRGSIRADRVTKPIISSLKEAGFYSFSCGIENFSDSALARMGKSASVTDNIHALEVFLSEGIHVQAGHILFDPGTTFEELAENYSFMRKYNWTTSKGIFTEMYAAKGTPLTRLIERKTKNLIAFDRLGNSTYQIEDLRVQHIYSGLKLWHKTNMSIYDKAIDPLSAPKSISNESFALFQNMSVTLRQKDLDLFEKLLSCEAADCIDVAKVYIDLQRDWYEIFSDELERAYNQSGLIYDGQPNPFIS